MYNKEKQILVKRRGGSSMEIKKVTLDSWAEESKASENTLFQMDLDDDVIAKLYEKHGDKLEQYKRSMEGQENE